MQDPGEAEAIKPEFVEWLLRSPQHLEEFLAIARVWGDTELASPDLHSLDALVAAARAQPEPDNVVAPPAFARSTMTAGVRRSRRNLKPLAIAATLAVLVVGAVAWFAVGRWLDPANVRTSIGEQRSVTLADGSVVDINTSSAMRIDLDDLERRIELTRGEARFKVAKDPNRPFIVTTPQATVRALGTVFNVYAGKDRTEVTVLEGHVEVREVARPTQQQSDSNSASRVELRTGQQAAVIPNGDILANVGAPIERVIGWTDRRLVFRDEALADVIAEFNRYHERPLRIDDAALGSVRISGTFDSSDRKSLIDYLERFERVQIEERADGSHLHRP
jgi:transmembrane sensor